MNIAKILDIFPFWRRRQEKKYLRERSRQARELLLQRWREKRVLLLQCLREKFEGDFLTAYEFYQTECTDHLSFEEYKTEKSAYVRSWAFGALDLTPDLEQLEAIGYTEGHVQVVARAGSGKTATLVNRTQFLEQHCGVAHDELLLLAFNKDAAEEMHDRLAEKLEGAIPHVMTFHALAYALVQPGQLLLDEPEGGQSLSRVLQDVVDKHLCDSEYADQFRDLMLAHFRDDWERHEDWQRIVSEGYGPEASEILQYRRSLTRETLDRKYVKSFGEKVIANFLFEHDIDYKYEWRFWWNGRSYHPDFTIFTGARGGIVIEYFGMAGDADYDEMSEDKRDYWRNKPGWELIEFFASDLGRNGEEGFRDVLKATLEAHAIQCNQLSEEEIWNQIESRSIDRFTRIVMGFIQRCRKLALSPEQLAEKVRNHKCVSAVEQQFLNLVHPLYAGYLQQLQSTEEEAEDFDGLLQKAGELVSAGETNFQRKSGGGDLKQIRFVMIDEYQDFSELFHRLMDAVREQNPGARFFCVGDDWQAINGFAGSDLYFFQNFEQLFEGAHTLPVATNYRSAPQIVDVGNALMREHGTPARAHKQTIGNVKIGYIDTFTMTSQEENDHFDDKLTPAVLRLVNKAVNNDKDVVLLSRMNRLPWKIHYEDDGESAANNELERFLELLHSHLPADQAKKVKILTAHRSKGLEGNVVIVLDAVPQCYPLIHPDSIFTRIFDSTIKRITAEERRLFYVALTRAEEDLYVLTETDNVSPFLEDLEGKAAMPRVIWADYPAVLSPSSDAIITIKVGNQRSGYGKGGTYAIKDTLRAEGYEWDGGSKVWHTTEPAVGFSFEEFQDKAEWAEEADGIEVRVFDYSDTETKRYHVDYGQWRSVSISHARFQ